MKKRLPTLENLNKVSKLFLLILFFGSFVFVFSIREALAAISYINSSTCVSSDDGLGTYTLTLPTTQQNDLVIVAIGTADNDNVDEDVGPNLVGTYGYTEVADLFSNDTTDSNLGVFWKVMGASPDTSYTLDSIGGNDASNAAVCMVFRGVDTGTPMDVTPATDSNINTMHPNPPSINHNNPSGVWTVIAGVAGHGINSGTFTFPTGYTTDAVERTHNDTSDATTGMGYRSSGVSDPEDPGVMTHSGTDSTNYSWAAVTIALRPAVNTAPTVTTNTETNVTSNSATLNGEITATGGVNATERGFAWGTDSGLSTVIGTTTETGDFGTGTFSQNVSNLIAGVTYYFRAYATNPVGTSYGNIDNLVASAADTTLSRKMRLFEGSTIKFTDGRIIIHQR